MYKNFKNRNTAFLQPIISEKIFGTQTIPPACRCTAFHPPAYCFV